MSANKYRNSKSIIAFAWVAFTSLQTSSVCADGGMFNFGTVEAPTVVWADALAADMVKSSDTLTRAQALVHQALSQRNDAAKVPFDESLAKIVQSKKTDIATLLLIYSHRCNVPHGQNFDAPVAFCSRIPAWERFAVGISATPGKQLDDTHFSRNRYVSLFVEQLLTEEYNAKLYLPGNQSSEAREKIMQNFRAKMAPWTAQAMVPKSYFDDYSQIYRRNLLLAMRRRPAPAALIQALPIELGKSINVEELAAELATNFAIYMARSKRSALQSCSRPLALGQAPIAQCQQLVSAGKLPADACPDPIKIASTCQQLAESILANGQNSAVSLAAAIAIQRVHGPKTAELARVEALLSTPDLHKAFIKPINVNQAQALRALIAFAIKNGDVAAQSMALNWLEVQARQVP